MPHQQLQQQLLWQLLQQQLPVRKIRKDYTFWRHCHEKPHNIPGCPKAANIQLVAMPCIEVSGAGIGVSTSSSTDPTCLVWEYAEHQSWILSSQGTELHFKIVHLTEQALDCLGRLASVAIAPAIILPSS